MIKNLLNADEEPPEGTKVVIEDSVVDPAATSSHNELSAEATAQNPEAPAVFEIPEESKFFTRSSETAAETTPLDEDSESISALMAELENLEPEDLKTLQAEIETAEPENLNSAETKTENSAPPVSPFETETEKTFDNLSSGTLFQNEYKPPSTAETIRQSGLAWSAGVVLFGAVVFMMIFGWFADLLLGSSPWGIVGGIILGGIIGFIQFFRITSQIFKK
jgi:F0F1-type ATP synthase assembly protein I